MDKDSLKQLLSAGLPVMLRGAAGTGKSSILRSIAEEVGRTAVDLRVAMMPPEDLVGIPKVNTKGGFFSYLAPEWAAEAASSKGSNLLIIIEEIHLAPPSMHAALYQLLQEKVIAGVDLSGAWVTATANPPEQAGSGLMADMPEALLDRLEMVEYAAGANAFGFLSNLADSLGVPAEVQKACGLKKKGAAGLPMTPRACERLLRLIAAGVRDPELIARRAGNVTTAVLAALQTVDGGGKISAADKIEVDILSRAATPELRRKNVVFELEGAA